MANQFSDAIQYLANRRPTRKERIGNIIWWIAFGVVTVAFTTVWVAGIIHIVGYFHK